MGDNVDHLDQREVKDLELSREEQTQLTKMSLGKIVNNLRQKLKEEEQRYKNLSIKCENLIKDKEAIRVKMDNMKREKKVNDFVNNPMAAKPTPARKPAVPVQEPAKAQEPPAKRLSFKQRRDLQKK